MKIALEISDGRTAADYLAQVTVADVHGDPVLVAYHGPAGAIICGHRGEDGWHQFLEDTGVVEKIDHGARRSRMVAKVVPIQGTVSVIPVRRVGVYSDAGDPVIFAVLTEDKVDVAHAGDFFWKDFCKRHGVFEPRKPIVQEIG